MWREEELLVLQIDINEEFIADAIDKATHFYKQCVLPEILGKWYTQSRPTTTAD
jgi:hypothetical protein